MRARGPPGRSARALRMSGRPGSARTGSSRPCGDAARGRSAWEASACGRGPAVGGAAGGARGPRPQAGSAQQRGSGAAPAPGSLFNEVVQKRNGDSGQVCVRQSSLSQVCLAPGPAPELLPTEEAGKKKKNPLLLRPQLLPIFCPQHGPTCHRQALVPPAGPIPTFPPLAAPLGSLNLASCLLPRAFAQTLPFAWSLMTSPQFQRNLYFTS